MSVACKLSILWSGSKYNAFMYCFCILHNWVKYANCVGDNFAYYLVVVSDVVSALINQNCMKVKAMLHDFKTKQTRFRGVSTFFLSKSLSRSFSQPPFHQCHLQVAPGMLSVVCTVEFTVHSTCVHKL